MESLARVYVLSAHCRTVLDLNFTHAPQLRFYMPDTNYAEDSLEGPSRSLEQARPRREEDISMGETVRKRRFMNPRAPFN